MVNSKIFRDYIYEGTGTVTLNNAKTGMSKVTHRVFYKGKTPKAGVEDKAQ